MRRLFGPFALLLLLCGGCSTVGDAGRDFVRGEFPSEPSIYMLDDLTWQPRDLDAYSVTGNDVRGVPFLPPINSRRDMEYSLLGDVLAGTRPDGLPSLRVPDGYQLMVWKEGRVLPSNDYVGWIQVFAYPNDWEDRARRGLHSRDIGWAFLRRTEDLSGWENMSREFPCQTYRRATPEEEGIANQTIWGTPRPSLWRVNGRDSEARQASSTPVTCRDGNCRTHN